MKLLLENLRLENYRIFRRLEIQRFGRANLFVGRNNVGKSSILEAIRLFATRGSQEAIWSILESHDETRMGSQGDVNDQFFAIKQLFHGRDAGWDPRAEIRIGPIDVSRRTLTIRVMALGHQNTTGNPLQPLFETSDLDDGRRLVLVSTYGDAPRLLPLDIDWRKVVLPLRSQDVQARQTYVSPHGLTTESAAKLWDLIALTDLEEDVSEALRIISPEIERISFIGESGRYRVPVAKLTSQLKPVPLRSLGDGVNRMLGLALSLASAQGGVLLVDEVENGIHFSAQSQLWQLIFRLARRLDTQVFATTHSWDCIEAFQHAASLDTEDEAALIRLDANRDAVLPTTFSERDLSIVTREQIEVR